MTKKKIREIADFICGDVIGDENIEVSNIRDIREAGKGDLAFILDPKFAPFLDNTKASCVVVPHILEKASCSIIRSKNPTLAYIQIVDFLNAGKVPHPKGIHESAIIGRNASLGENVAIAPYCVLSDNVRIGARTVLYPFSFIGENTVIGEDSIIYPNVSIRENIKIGSRVIIHSGSVVGSDGFGFDNSTGKNLKVPQIGSVVIEDDVEIGSCVTIDRAKFAQTKIGKGTKIDNLVQIAHNVEIGEKCIIAAQCGISGSCKLGESVIMGGQVGIADHVTLCNNVMIGAQSGVMKSVPSDTIVLGSPAHEIRHQRKVYILEDRLPELYERLKKIEKKVESLGPAEIPSQKRK